MIKSLVSLNPDLASSIALRYACRLSELTGMDIRTIHVEEADENGHPPGTGWVRRTWEDGLVQNARDKIAQLINAEKAQCQRLGMPKICIGDHDTELLRELNEAAYDLLVEGILHSFTAKNFYQKVNSRLYRQAFRPILLVKNLVEINRVALVLEPGRNIRPLVPTALKIFNGTTVETDIYYCNFIRKQRLTSQETTADTIQSLGNEPAQALSHVLAGLSAGRQSPGKIVVLEGDPKSTEVFWGDYSMVLACMSLNIDKKAALLECLSRVPSAVVLCR